MYVVQIFVVVVFEIKITSRQEITLFHIIVSNYESSPSFRDPQ